MTDETPYWIVIFVTTAAFFALAAALLIPVYRFLVREEEASKEWSDIDPEKKDDPLTGNGIEAHD